MTSPTPEREKAPMLLPTDTPCEICQGTKQMHVLNLWKANRKYQVNGGDIKKAIGPTADDLPFIVIENACFKCCGEEAADTAMLALQERMGGNPFNPATYEKEDGQA